MALKKVSKTDEAGYPPFDEHHRSRRRFLRDVAAGVGAVVATGSLSGCLGGAKETAGVPPRPTPPTEGPSDGSAAVDGDGPPPKDDETWMGTTKPPAPTETRLPGRVVAPERLSGEVMPPRPPTGKPLGGKPMIPRNPADAPLPGSMPAPRPARPERMKGIAPPPVSRREPAAPAPRDDDQD